MGGACRRRRRALDREAQPRGRFVREGGGGRATAGGRVVCRVQREAKARAALPADPPRELLPGRYGGDQRLGARTFKYGPRARTSRFSGRAHDRRLRTAPGERSAARTGASAFRSRGPQRRGALPTTRCPRAQARRGYFTQPGMDLIDLFREARARSARHGRSSYVLPHLRRSLRRLFSERGSLLPSSARRAGASTADASAARRTAGLHPGGHDARALEYFDGEALTSAARALPAGAARGGGRVFFGGERRPDGEGVERWLEPRSRALPTSRGSARRADRAEMRASATRCP